MNKNSLSFSLFFGVLLVLVSCGGDDDTTINTVTEARWQFNDIDYRGGRATQVISEADNGQFGVLEIVADLDATDGVYTGSSLEITYALSGDGSYTIVDQSDFEMERNANPSAKILAILCTVGTGTNTGATRYEALVGGSISVTIRDDGEYQFVATNLSVSKTLDVDGGVPDAPRTGVLGITDAYNLPF